MSDIVNEYNELKYREAFCESVGHSMDCVENTIDKMVTVLNAVSQIYNVTDITSLIEQMGVEKFEHHLTRLIFHKQCDCKRKPNGN